MRPALAVLALTATGCTPGFFPGEHGWWSTQQHYQPVHVANIPMVVDDTTVVAPWNWIAGWQLFEPWSATPQVTFHEMTPICANGNCADRRQAWVQRFTDEGWLQHVVIHYDPTFVQWPWAVMFQHELGHALSLAGDRCDRYRGVMSYCSFPYQPDRFRQPDVDMLTNTGYR